MSITSREEARRVLECISPTLVRSVVALTIANTKTSRDLAKALGMSLRNAQRVINSLESIKAIKVVRYGRQKIIASLNKHFEKEVLESIEALLPLIIDSLKIPPLKASDHYREVTLQLVKRLGINAKPKDFVFNMVKNLLSKEIKNKPMPHWLKRIVNVYCMREKRMRSDNAKHLRWYSDNPYTMRLREVSTLAFAHEDRD